MDYEALPPIEKDVSNGTFRFINTNVGIGAVLAVSTGNKMLFIQKAARQGYAFSNRWALPGGMLRSKATITSTLEDAPFCQFLSERVAAETGLLIPARMIMPTRFFPPITSYEAKGVRRWTAVFSFSAHVDEMAPIDALDASISAVEWRVPLVALPDCAPANQLIIWRLHALNFDSTGKQENPTHIESAFEMCNAWAQEIGFPSVPI